MDVGEDIPPGLCQCGCGEPTAIVPGSCFGRGLVKGEPFRFVHGHNSRLPRKVPPPLYRAGEHVPHSDTAWSYKIALRRRDGTTAAFTLVDEGDYESLSLLRWHRPPIGYAARTEKVAGEKRLVLMHRQIMGLAYGDPLEVDHVRGDRLDNRRFRLRVVTRQQQLQNVPSRGGTSAYRGVSWNARAGKWQAEAKVAGQLRRLGHFVDEAEAARVAAAFRAEHMPFSVPGR